MPSNLIGLLLIASAVGACASQAPATLPTTATGRSAATAPVGERRAPALVTASSRHFCAFLGGPGDVRCWGSNDYGQLGDGTRRDRTAPTPVKGLPALAVKRLEAGSHLSTRTCAIMADDSVYCWGSEDHFSQDQPDLVAKAQRVGHPISQIVFTSSHTCALTKTGGRVLCWDYGKAPAPVAGLKPVRQLFSMIDGFCGRHHDGTLSCWDSDNVSKPTSPSGQKAGLSKAPFKGDVVSGAFALKGETLGGRCVKSQFLTRCIVTAPRTTAQLVVSAGRVCGLSSGGQLLCGPRKGKQTLDMAALWSRAPQRVLPKVTFEALAGDGLAECAATLSPQPMLVCSKQSWADSREVAYHKVPWLSSGELAQRRASALTAHNALRRRASRSVIEAAKYLGSVTSDNMTRELNRMSLFVMWARTGRKGVEPTVPAGFKSWALVWDGVLRRGECKQALLLAQTRGVGLESLAAVRVLVDTCGKALAPEAWLTLRRKVKASGVLKYLSQAELFMAAGKRHKALTYVEGSEGMVRSWYAEGRHGWLLPRLVRTYGRIGEPKKARALLQFVDANRLSYTARSEGAADPTRQTVGRGLVFAELARWYAPKLEKKFWAVVMSDVEAVGRPRAALLVVAALAKRGHRRQAKALLKAVKAALAGGPHNTSKMTTDVSSSLIAAEAQLGNFSAARELVKQYQMATSAPLVEAMARSKTGRRQLGDWVGRRGLDAGLVALIPFLAKRKLCSAAVGIIRGVTMASNIPDYGLAVLARECRAELGLVLVGGPVNSAVRPLIAGHLGDLPWALRLMSAERHPDTLSMMSIVTRLAVLWTAGGSKLDGRLRAALWQFLDLADRVNP